MLQLKLNHKPFSPPYAISISFRNFRGDLDHLKEKAFEFTEKNGMVSLVASLNSFKETEVFSEVKEMVEWAMGRPWSMELPGGRILRKEKKPLIMGILNVTPDSFYDGGKFNRLDAAISRAERMVKEGVDIIDVGGESTRPGSQGVNVEEEIKRVVPVIRELRKRFDIPISIDTTKSQVAEVALGEGADMVNDISGLRFDERMAEVCAKKNAPVVIMHTTGRPSEMQKRIFYKDLIWDILDYLWDSMELAERSGIPRDRIIIDPGIGFGKRPEHNLIIINRLLEFKSLKRPVLVGASRKSFIGFYLGLENPKDRLEGSLAVSAVLSLLGADIIRVHDVRETRMVVDMISHILEEG